MAALTVVQSAGLKVVQRVYQMAALLAEQWADLTVVLSVPWLAVNLVVLKVEPWAASLVLQMVFLMAALMAGSSAAE
jgi:hypothetical protein